MAKKSDHNKKDLTRKISLTLRQSHIRMLREHPHYDGNDSQVLRLILNEYGKMKKGVGDG